MPYQVGPFRASSRGSEEDQGRPLEHEVPEGGAHITEEPEYLHSSTKDTDEERGQDHRRCHDGNTSIRGRNPGGPDGHEAGPESRDGHSCPDHASAAEERAGRILCSAISDERSPAATDSRGGEEGYGGEPRAGDPTGEAHADAHPGQESGHGSRPSSKLQEITSTKTEQALPVWAPGRGLDRQEGRTEEGAHVLEMRPTPMRPLRMDRREGPGRPRRGEDGGFIPEPKKVQEPEEGGLSGGSYGGEQLVSGVGEQQQSGKRASGGCGGVRRLGDGWTRCCASSAIRWARRAQQGSNPLVETYGNLISG